MIWFLYMLLMVMIVGTTVMIDADDIITTIAGTGTASFSGDGSIATSATLNYPLGAALDTLGRNCLFTFL